MKAISKRGLAMAGGALMVFGLAATPASATGNDDRDGRDWRRDRGPSCSLDLDVDRRGNLDVDIDSNLRNAVAVVVADFDRGRDARDRVRLNVRGDGSTEFDIPRAARSVDVTAYIWNGRGFTRCSEDLSGRRGPRGGGFLSTLSGDRDWRDWRDGRGFRDRDRNDRSHWQDRFDRERGRR